MLVWLINVWAICTVFLSYLIALMTSIGTTVTRVLLSLHHTFWICKIPIAVGKTLRRVLMLPLWIVLVMATASCCHRLVYTITIRCFLRWWVTRLHMFWSGSWSVWASRYYAWIHIMGTVHFLLASWSTMMSWTRMTNSWGSSFIMTSGRLSVSRSMDILISLLCRKLTCFCVTVIVKPQRRIMCMGITWRISLRLIAMKLVILVFGN